MPKSKEVTTTATGGLKGFFQRAGSSFKAGGILAKDYTYWLGLKGARVAFIFATTSIVVFMPLIFEISRESMSIEIERAQAKDLRSQGYSDRQLTEMGLSELAIRPPSVALQK